MRTTMVSNRTFWNITYRAISSFKFSKTAEALNTQKSLEAWGWYRRLNITLTDQFISIKPTCYNTHLMLCIISIMIKWLKKEERKLFFHAYKMKFLVPLHFTELAVGNSQPWFETGSIYMLPWCTLNFHFSFFACSSPWRGTKTLMSDWALDENNRIMRGSWFRKPDKNNI